MKISADVQKDLNKATDILDQQKQSFLNMVSNDIRTYLENSTPNKCLTIIEEDIYSGYKYYYPEVTLKYFTVLSKFCLNSKCNGNKLDSALTSPIIDAVVTRYQKLFAKNADEIGKFLTAAITKDKVFESALKESLESSLTGTIPAATKDLIMQNVTREIVTHTQNALQTQAASSAMDVVGTTVAKVAGSAVSSPIVAKIAIALAHNLATTLAAQVKIVLAKLLASGALKTVLVGKLKAVLAGTLLVAIAQTISAKLAAFGIAIGPGAAIAIIVLPVLALFMRYEYKSLPKKLADKVPTKVIEELNGQYKSVNLTVIDNVYKNLIATGVGISLKSVLKNLPI